MSADTVDMQLENLSRATVASAESDLRPQLQLEGPYLRGILKNLIQGDTPNRARQSTQ